MKFGSLSDFLVMLLKYAPWPIARDCLYIIIYLFIDRAITGLLTYWFFYRERPGCLVDSACAKEDLEGAEVHDKRTENP